MNNEREKSSPTTDREGVAGPGTHYTQPNWLQASSSIGFTLINRAHWRRSTARTPAAAAMKLPVEVSLHILGYLDRETLGRVVVASRRLSGIVIRHKKALNLHKVNLELSSAPAQSELPCRLDKFSMRAVGGSSAERRLRPPPLGIVLWRACATPGTAQGCRKATKNKYKYKIKYPI